MSVETASIAPPEVKKEGLFSKKNRKILRDPLDDNNPITVQILGVCSALAVTTQVKPAIIMALGVTIVTAFSNLIIAAIRQRPIIFQRILQQSTPSGPPSPGGVFVR